MSKCDDPWRSEVHHDFGLTTLWLPATLSFSWNWIPADFSLVFLMWFSCCSYGLCQEWCVSSRLLQSYFQDFPYVLSELQCFFFFHEKQIIKQVLMHEDILSRKWVMGTTRSSPKKTLICLSPVSWGASPIPFPILLLSGALPAIFVLWKTTVEQYIIARLLTNISLCCTGTAQAVC